MAGFPNGRRLADDTPDIELRALAGGTPFTPDFNVAPNNKLGDGVNTNDTPFLNQFPYGYPHQGYASDPHYVRGSTTTTAPPLAGPDLRVPPSQPGARRGGAGRDPGRRAAGRRFLVVPARRWGEAGAARSVAGRCHRRGGPAPGRPRGGGRTSLGRSPGSGSPTISPGPGRPPTRPSTPRRPGCWAGPPRSPTATPAPWSPAACLSWAATTSAPPCAGGRRRPRPT